MDNIHPVFYNPACIAARLQGPENEIGAGRTLICPVDTHIIVTNTAAHQDVNRAGASVDAIYAP
ncbi:MAG: hypothetical protein VYE18_06400 [Pseudomonadota bacterium]|nr:hypothetical protein [Pseudomonadota bacterium]